MPIHVVFDDPAEQSSHGCDADDAYDGGSVQSSRAPRGDFLVIHDHCEADGRRDHDDLEEEVVQGSRAEVEVVCCFFFRCRVSSVTLFASQAASSLEGWKKRTIDAADECEAHLSYEHGWPEDEDLGISQHC